MEFKRRTASVARKSRIQFLRKTAGGKTAPLWRTCLMPGTCHGATVSGMTKETLRILLGAL
eukprot:7437897-Pyramimonas_sp.AAC.1